MFFSFIAFDICLILIRRGNEEYLPKKKIFFLEMENYHIKAINKLIMLITLQNG